MNSIKNGFTLLEMLVAIAVLAILALMGQQIIDGVSRAKIVSQKHEVKIKNLLQTINFMNNDFTQIIPRSIRSDNGQREPALLSGLNILDSNSHGIRFIRGGVINPQMQLPRSHLTKIGYRIHKGYLERLSWPTLDTPAHVKPIIHPLVEAESLTIQLYDGTKWIDHWQGDPSPIIAIKIQLKTSQYQTIERIWLLKVPNIEKGISE